MGFVIQKILGDFSQDPRYDNLTIENNSDGKVHIHIKGVRLDMRKEAYNKLRETVLIARDKLKK
jgi:hypothetical protein